MKEFVEELIERLEVRMRMNEMFHNSIINNGIVVALGIINDLASEHNNGWISVDDELPSENGWYLVTNRLGVVQQQCWGANHWQKLTDDFVVAWMKMPAPYRNEEPKDKLSDTWKQNTMSRFERVE